VNAIWGICCVSCTSCPDSLSSRISSVLLPWVRQVVGKQWVRACTDHISQSAATQQLFIFSSTCTIRMSQAGMLQGAEHDQADKQARSNEW
jgi:hypothetical protein